MKTKFTGFNRIILSIGMLMALLPSRAQSTYSDQYLDSVIVQVAQVLNNTKDWRIWLRTGSEKTTLTNYNIMNVSPSNNFSICFTTDDDVYGKIVVNLDQNVFMTSWNDCKSTNDPYEEGIRVGGDLLIHADYPVYSCGSPKRIKAITEGNERIRSLFKLLAPFRARYDAKITAYSDSIRATIIAEEERKRNEFEKAAEEYRSSSVKPEITEEQRKYIVQANALADEKKIQ